jgi:hypothetical protein
MNQAPGQQQNQMPSSTGSSESQSQSGMTQGQGTQDTTSGQTQENTTSQTQPQPSSASGASESESESVASRIHPQTENGITYVCGGVGEQEAAYMKKSARDYDLMLTFTSRTGQYLADVDVAIKDAKGKEVLRTTCDSPMLLVDLPRSGVYHVQAKAEDYSLRKTVRVKAKGHTNSVVMSWPRVREEEGVAAVPSNQQPGTSSGSSESESRGSSGNDQSDRSNKSDNSD